MIKDKNRVADLLKDIFTERPISRLDRFLTSSLMDTRRAMSSENHLVGDYSVAQYTKLPGWLRSNVALPPWEKQILASLSSNRPVAVVQGGSGCGKTSTLHYLRQYTRRLPRKSQGEAAHFFEHVILTVDLQDQPPSLKDRRETEQERRDQTTEFLEAFVMALDAELQATLTDAHVTTLFKQAFLSDFGPTRDVAKRTTTAFFNVRNRFNKQMLGKEPEGWRHITPALDSSSKPYDQILTRYFLLQELGRNQWDTHNRKVLLVIDNVDPFPEYIQTSLIRTFETIAHGYDVDHESEMCFSIALFARLSTSPRKSAFASEQGAEMHLKARPDGYSRG